MKHLYSATIPPTHLQLVFIIIFLTFFIFHFSFHLNLAEGDEKLEIPRSFPRDLKIWLRACKILKTKKDFLSYFFCQHLHNFWCARCFKGKMFSNFFSDQINGVLCWFGFLGFWVGCRKKGGKRQCLITNFQLAANPKKSVWLWLLITALFCFSANRKFIIRKKHLKIPRTFFFIWLQCSP